MEGLSVFKDSSSTKIKDPFNSLYFAITVCFSQIYFGHVLLYLSAVDFSVIVSIYSIDFDTHYAQGLFQGISPIGGAFGAMASTYLVSKLSRRQTIHFLGLVASILAVVSLYPNYLFFLIVRFLQGACAGLISSVIPMIVKEGTPLQMASITGALPNLLIILGLFFTYFFSFVLGLISGDFTGASTWKIIFLTPIILMALQSFIIWKYYPYQTPKYLAQFNRKEELKNFITQFYKPEFIQQRYDYNFKHYGPRESQQLQGHHAHQQSKTAFIFGIFYALLCPMVGINIIFAYCNDIAAEIFPFLKPFIGSILQFLFFIFSAISIIYVNRYGRKEMTLWGTYGVAFCLYVMALSYFIASGSPSLAQFLLFVFMILYLFAYGMTYAPLMWMFLAEALQPSKIGYAVTVNWGGAALAIILFPIVQSMVPNQGYIFVFFALFATFSVIVINKFMLETKDKTEHQITEEYRILDQQLWSQTKTNEMEMKLVQQVKQR